MLGLISEWAACLVPAGEDREGHVYFPDNVMSQINNLFAKTELKVLSEIFILLCYYCVCDVCVGTCNIRDIWMSEGNSVTFHFHMDLEIQTQVARHAQQVPHWSITLTLNSNSVESSYHGNLA